MKQSVSNRTMSAAIYSSLLLLGLVTLYPFWNSVVIAFNSGSDTSMGGVTFWPREFTLENFKIVLQDNRIIHSFIVSVLRTAIGTFLSIFFTSMFAYGMSKKNIVFKKYYMVFCVITMYFSGGLIPYFLLIRNLGMMNSIWVMIIPSIISVWNMIIFRTFFNELPDALEESATLDGCNAISTFFRIIVPVSGPVIATLSLFTAVYHWNDWFTATIFINKANLTPIQTLLQQILNSNIASEMLQQASGGNAAALEQLNRQQTITTKSLSMATMVVSTVPIMMVYPFLQKYFVKGVLVGSIKG
ncbi:carbohydrate ABC transporter permease [Cohnella endophytica]|uniref:Carbohydrate ABC transporter permease n=1 Tax=Cohnella endophytica TaxID=2419778 RepID=A0A494XUW0_9BACL|nr:carbohydrate ABC transporter permease [Cohnella endophytica]RKP54348.1 carbohydrate ABC transporter permease [Cohnella endophytica]